MDGALQIFLESHFKTIEESMSRIFEKLESINLETNGNTKDIKNLKETIDDKLKGFRISQEACQSNCKIFREDMKKEIGIKIESSERKTKNVFLVMIISGIGIVISFVISLLTKFWG